jgi:hypothetical protein
VLEISFLHISTADTRLITHPESRVLGERKKATWKIVLGRMVRTSFQLYSIRSPLLIPHLRLALVRLETTQTILLVNVAVSLLLHPVLEDHGYAKNENEVDSDNAESGSEDLVEVPVGKGREFANASTLLRCNEGVGTSAVLYEWRRGRVCVATAIELASVSI